MSIDQVTSAHPLKPVDVSAAALLLVPGVVAFGPAFGGVPGYLPAIGGSVLGFAIALVSRWRGWRWTAVLPAAIAAYLVFGGALALPRTTIGGVIPTLETLRRLVVLVVAAWRDLLTVSLPASEFTGPAVVPLVSGLCCSLLALRLAVRGRASALAVLPAGSLLIVGILWGTHQAPYAVWQGLLLAAVALLWQVARRRAVTAGDITVAFDGGSALSKASVVPALAVTVAAGVGAAFLATFVVPSSRFVLRDVVEPPLDTRQFASPLTMFRYLERDLRDQVLLTVDGLPAGSRVRLAAVDSYDGVVYNIDSASSNYRLVGQEIGQPGEPGVRTTMRLVIGAYEGVWVPGAADLRGVRFSTANAPTHLERVYYNADTGTAISTAGIGAGTSYEIDAVTGPSADATRLAGAALAQVSMPQNKRVPDAVGTAAAEYVGTSTSPYEQLQSVAKKLKETGFFSDGSDGKSRAGHTAERIATLLTAKQMIGDDEQYAVAFALMARHLGMPARVVMGFYPTEQRAGANRIELTGADAHVWVEVAFEGQGWVVFDPAPPRDKKPQTDVPQPKRDPKPQVLPPPDPPVERPDARADIADDNRKPPVDEGSAWLRIVLAVVGAIGVLGLLLLPFVVVLLLKRRRRRRRLAQPRMVDRISGGWAEVVDAATDLGADIDPAHTRQEAAAALGAAFAAGRPVAVAERVDAVVFGAGQPTQADVEHMWTEVDSLLHGMAESVPRHRRWRARFSLRSLGLSSRSARSALAAAGRGVVRVPSRLVGRVVSRRNG